MAQLELLNALNSITSEAELNEFKNLLAHYFAQKAQKVTPPHFSLRRSPI